MVSSLGPPKVWSLPSVPVLLTLTTSLPSFSVKTVSRVIFVAGIVFVAGADQDVKFVIFIRESAVVGDLAALLSPIRVRWGAAAEAARLVRVGPIHRFGVARSQCFEPYGTVRGDRMVADVMDAGAVAP